MGGHGRVVRGIWLWRFQQILHQGRNRLLIGAPFDVAAEHDAESAFPAPESSKRGYRAWGRSCFSTNQITLSRLWLMATLVFFSPWPVTNDEPFAEAPNPFPRCGPGGFHKGCQQKLVGLFDPAAFALSRRLVIARANPRQLDK
jgi:hypothetical protein